MQSASPSVYFHLGLGKTGTTFLQYRAFPYFKGVQYIQRTRYKQAKSIIAKSSNERFFISFECDQQLEKVARNWALDYPQTTPILVFRRHDSWIASQYRRFVKNCHVRKWTEFIDLEKDSGRFQVKDLEYYPMVTLLDSIFDNKVIVLLYDDMRKDPAAFIKYFAGRLNASIDTSAIDFSHKHSSYSERQLKFLKRVSQNLPLEKKKIFSFVPLEFIRKWAVEGTRYLILFIGKFAPDSTEPLIDTNDLATIREYYTDDWHKILERAEHPSN